MSYLKDLIDTDGRPLRAIADASGIAESTVHRVYHGHTSPSRATIAAIARACGGDVLQAIQQTLAEGRNA